MIEATCAACGTVARIAESDVPVGAKFVTCASCKARVPLPVTATPPKGVPVKSVAIPTIPKAPPPTPSAKKDVELADLPAPKRTNPLLGAEPSKPAPPRSPLAGADLPVPKAAKPPASPPGALDLDDLMPSGDMPAPKPKATDAGLADLPAPKAKTSALGDLPGGKGKQGNALADLPAPKAKTSALADLPAPKAKTSALADLPAPKRPSGVDDGLDLPAPKPGANNDLPAPKGFFDDLPQPAKAGSQKGPAVGAAPTVDLPAPKGFFDDLPQPAKGGGKGGAGTTDVAPKGFFDDLPQPAKGGGKGAQTTDVAPKGFFDDLPQPAKGGGAQANKAGLFDDLPQPTKGAPAPAGGGGGGGLFDDLPQPSSSAELALDLGGGGGNALDLGSGGGGGAGPDLDLGLPLGENGGFQDLDLGEPVRRGPAGPAPEENNPIKIKTPAKGAAPAKPIQIVVPKDPKQAAAELKLDLADDPQGGPGAPAATAKGGKTAAKKKGPTPEEAAEMRAAKRRRTRILLGAVLGLAVIGGGGFFFYNRHMAQKARKEKIESGTNAARAALKDEKPNHWTIALNQAQSVIDIDPNNVAALGLAAEASFAGALDSGVNGPTRIAQGRKFMTTGLGAAKSTVELDRAQALSYLAANQFDKAIPRLQGLITQNGGDGWLQLYMGWAQLGLGDADAALKAFDQAVAKTKQTKIPALYGQGRAKLLLADIAGARTIFETLTTVDLKADDPRSVCPQVQLAATLEPSKAAQRDADLRGILARKDVKAADPRCITQIYVNLGDVAATNGRLDIARESYRKAIASTANDVDALVGLARVEIHENKLSVAADDITKALAANPTAPHAQLGSAELQVAQGKLSDAQKSIEALAARKPALAKLDQAQLQLVKGKLLVAQGKPEDAIAAYSEGAKLAGDLDLAPTMAAVTLLTDLAKKETDPAKAADYKRRMDDLLAPFATRAQDDAQLASQLGVAYLQAGDPEKAETFLRRAVEMHDEDADAKVSLAMALVAQNKTDDALAQLNAALKIDATRPDFLLQLAITYQAAGNNDKAIETYDKLLANPDAPIVVRANAGKYYVKLGLITRKEELIKKGAAQSEPILKADPENAAGLYLKGEGLLLQKKYDDAAPALVKSTDIDPDAIYLDALGRASEGRFKTSDDKKFVEAARNAYERATKQDPKLVHAQMGLGAMYVQQGHYDQAIPPLIEANRLDPVHSEIMFQLGLAYFGQRNLGKDRAAAAGQWLEASLTKGTPPLEIEDRALAAYDLGKIYDEFLGNAVKCAAAWEQSQALAEEWLKQGGDILTIKWPYVENYYYLGDNYQKMNNPVAQKKAFLKYLDHNPKDVTHVQVVKQALATTLQRF